MRLRTQIPAPPAALAADGVSDTAAAQRGRARLPLRQCLSGGQRGGSLPETGRGRRQAAAGCLDRALGVENVSYVIT